MSLWLDSSPLKVQATVPNRLFGPVDARDRAKACRFEDDDAAARNIRVYPSYVVNIGRIRRDVNPGPNAVFPECSGKFGRAIPHQGREAGGDGELRPPPSLHGCSRTISCVPQQNPRKLMTDPTAEIPPELFARLARPTVRLSGSIDEAAAASFLSQVLPTLDVPGSIVVELFSSGGEAEVGRRLAQEVRLLRQAHGRDMWFLGKTLVASAAVTFMAAFPRDRRWLTRDTTLLIHGRRMMRNGHLEGPLGSCRRVLEEIIADIDNGLRVEDEGFAELIVGSAVSLDDIRRRSYGGWYLSASQALEPGLVAGLV